jgi:large subunit ribosomal protein L22
MEVKSKLRFIRLSPLKARIVADAVRGEPIENAVTLLRNLNKKAAGIVLQVLNAAIASARQLKAVDVDALFVKKITVDGGPIVRRFRPRSMGRANRIRKRTSHIEIILSEN